MTIQLQNVQYNDNTTEKKYNTSMAICTIYNTIQLQNGTMQNVQYKYDNTTAKSTIQV